MHVGCLWQIVPSYSRRAPALSPVIKLFFVNVLQCPAFQIEISKNLFETVIFVIKILHLLNIRSLLTAVLCFPFLIAGFRYASFTANNFDGPACFDRLHAGDYQVPSESGFSHGDLLRGHNQYVERSLRVNGAVNRDTYSRVG